MNEQQITDFAIMKADIHHLKKSFDDFKKDTEEYHVRQGKILDDLARSFQEFGGLANITSANVSAIAKINDWLTPKQQTIEFMIEDFNRSAEMAKDSQNLDKKEIFDWVIRISTMVALIALGGGKVVDLFR